MSRKQDENMMKVRKHKAAVDARKNADPTAKRQRQKFTQAALKMDEAERSKTQPDAIYRADTAKGRRQITRAEKRSAAAIEQANKNDAALMAAVTE